MSPDRIETELFGHAKGRFAERHQSRDGLFYYAQGGTLFLDEVAELPLAVQADAAARARRPAHPTGGQRAAAGGRRAHHRRHQPSAGRRSDCRAFAQGPVLPAAGGGDRAAAAARAQGRHPGSRGALHSAAGAAAGVEPIDVSPTEMDYLSQYHWPGNVRELRNLIERSLILGTLNVSALLSRWRRGLPRAEPQQPTDLHKLEKRHILAVLESVAGDKTRAAQLLGISRRTLERRCAEWA